MKAYSFNKNRYSTGSAPINQQNKSLKYTIFPTSPARGSPIFWPYSRPACPCAPETGKASGISCLLQPQRVQSNNRRLLTDSHSSTANCANHAGRSFRAGTRRTLPFNFELDTSVYFALEWPRRDQYGVPGIRACLRALNVDPLTIPCRLSRILCLNLHGDRGYVCVLVGWPRARQGPCRKCRPTPCAGRY